MKRNGVRFLITSLLLLLFVVNFVDATESDPKRSEDENKNESKITVKVESKDELKETLTKKKDDNLEVEEGKAKSKPMDRNEEETLKGGPPVEECDPSNRCVDVKSKFVACLRVPGKDSLDLSLLIQNNGTGSLDVNVVAPDFVKLEQITVQLQAKENKEVKVSVKEGGGNDTAIVIKAGEGSCSLNFQNIISDHIRKSDASASYGHFIHVRTSLALAVLAAFVLVGSAWWCNKHRRMKNQGGDPTKYQPLEMGLPISTGGKKDANEADGWDNNWEDDWDDEEARPMTPSKPVSTPSAKRLAPRRLSKDSWKD